MRRHSRVIALRIAVLYAAMACLWILLSDRLLHSLLADPLLESRIQTLKGWIFVIVTAVGLYVLIRRGLIELLSSRAVARLVHSQLVTAVESLSKGLILWDRDDRLLLCNSACRAMFSRLGEGLRRGADFESLLAGLSDYYGVTVEGGSAAIGAVRRTMDPMATYTQEFRLNDGRWIELSERRIGNDGIVALFTDISHAKRWEEAMSAMVMQSQRHRPFFEAVAEAAATALDCRWTAVAVLSGAGGSLARLDLAAVWRDGEAAAPYSLDLTESVFAALLDGSYHSAVGDPSALMGGASLDISVAGYAVMPFFTRRERPMGYLLALRTEPKVFDQEQRRFLHMMARWVGADYDRSRAVEALRENERRLRLALQLDEIAVFLQDRNLIYTWIHNPYRGYPVEEVVGKSDADLMLVEDAVQLTRIKSKVIETGEGSRNLVTVSDPKTRQRHYYRLIVEPLRDASGMVTGLRGATIDVTEEQRIKRDLELARAKAEWASQAKSRFLAAASHDMRQPLQAMRLFLDVLQTKVQDRELRLIADKACEALEAGTGLLNALLDVSSLEAGLVHPHIGEVSVSALFETVAAGCRPAAMAKGLTLRVMSCGVMIRSDPALLSRILLNLLSNAVRHTDKGGIVLGCRRRGGKALLEVWDTGPGIAADQLDAIWEEFYQIGNPERDRRLGLGLGLPIVERMVRLLGHRVTVRSRPGKGSVFTVEVEMAGQVAKKEGDAPLQARGHLP